MIEINYTSTVIAFYLHTQASYGIIVYHGTTIPEEKGVGHAICWWYTSRIICSNNVTSRTVQVTKSPWPPWPPWPLHSIFAYCNCMDVGNSQG